MAFNGYYIKVGSYKIPLDYMKEDSYKQSTNVQDLDSYRDGDGKMHRNVLPHVVHKAEFETPYLTNAQMRTLWDNIIANMTNTLNQDLTIEMYVEKTGTYHTGEFYMPGTIEIPRMNKEMHSPMRIAFIEY